MDSPTTVDELFQFIHRSRWMSNCIPDFQWISQSLSEILERAYPSCESRRKTALRNVTLSRISSGRDEWCIILETEINLETYCKSSPSKRRSHDSDIHRRFKYVPIRDSLTETSIADEDGNRKAAARTFGISGWKLFAITGTFDSVRKGSAGNN